MPKRFGFPDEALHLLLIRGESWGQDFQGHSALQLRVLRKINFVHPARAERRTDYVAAQSCPCINGHDRRERLFLERLTRLV